MMSTFFLLNAEAESGFGFKFDVIEANLINLAIIFVLLIVYGGKVVGNILSERRAKIEAEIKSAEARAKEAKDALAKAQKDLKEAQATVVKIRSEAETNAQKAKEIALAKGQQEVERLKSSAAADLNSEQERAIAQLRARAVEMALQRVESRMGEVLNDDKQRQLIDRSIANIGE
ncbi:MAG: F0F1 ATP synthase subunit B [Cyanobacteria bacterium P01_G01_bin.19]